MARCVDIVRYSVCTVVCSNLFVRLQKEKGQRMCNMSKKHRGQIIFMSKILVRSIVFRPPCPFGIKIAPIEIQSPCDGVESVTNLYMYEQMSKSTTGCVVILNYFMSIYLLKKRNKNKTEHPPPLNPPNKTMQTKRNNHTIIVLFFSLRRNIL